MSDNKASRSKVPLIDKFERDETGSIVINMTVKNDDGFLSPYSTGSTPVISSEVAEFIENSTLILPPRARLVLRIHSDCIDGNEQQIYREAVKEYFAQRHSALCKERRFNLVAVIALAIAGITTLALSFLIDNVIWAEVVDIVAWVLLWEATDIGIFKSRSQNRDLGRYLALSSMKVDYRPTEDR